jgi:hypothetical protein
VQRSLSALRAASETVSPAPGHEGTLPYRHMQSSQGEFVARFDVLAEDGGDDILVCL